MNLGLDQDIDAADTIQLDLLVLIIPPVAHLGEIYSLRIEFLVS